ncbi:MAG: ATP-dependent RecD-like DNA helicase [Desulfosalsimonadaceae bacterium]
MPTLNGRIDHIAYHDASSRFTVARLVLPDASRPVTVVGHMPSPAAGEEVSLTGRWSSHPKYGQQFRIESITLRMPSGAEAIRGFLASGPIKGIGSATAEKIISKFGEDTFSVIESTPEKLTQVEGIGASTAAAVHEQWHAIAACRRVMSFLQENGISGTYAQRLYNIYGRDTIKIISSSPYRLARDLAGSGFAIADRIAKNMGTDPDDPERAEACIHHLMQAAAGRGHLFLYENELSDQASRLYDIPPDTISAAMEELIETQELTAEEDFAEDAGRRIYPRALYDAEATIAARLAALLSLPPPPPPQNPALMIENIQAAMAIELTPDQYQALEVVLASRVAVITGGPGTGKTTLIRAVAALFGRNRDRICLAAPTGRAARRLSEVSGKTAHTIHKLLAYNFDDNFFGRHQDNPIDAELLIIDEASMVDAHLMAHLLQAVSFSTRLVIVGDAFQLPPVGPGNVLADLIAADIIPTARLTTIFRQAAESRIIRNAHLVRQGRFPELCAFSETDFPDAEFYFREESDPEAIAEAISYLCARLLPAALGLDPLSAVQVLSPIHKGPVGTINLNQKLQFALNPQTTAMAGSGSRFCTGDKVMNLKNNYSKEIYNGDIGRILQANPQTSELLADFCGREVAFAGDELGDLTLGYAISVHKSQGSEYPAVILPLVSSHHGMLQRNLLYTAITRARSLVILIGSKKALSTALANNTPEQRLSGLTQRLQQAASD